MTRNDESTLSELLLQWEELQEAGKEISPAELCRHHPHLLPLLTRRIQILNVTSWLDQPLFDHSNPPQQRESAATKVLAGRYRLENLIAVGGFAEVWQGYDAELQRLVAVKIPKPDRLQSSDAFLAEARRVARLKHPAIVQVYDVGQDADHCFIVSEFIEGGSLDDLLRFHPPSPQQAIRWIIQIAEALDYAHLHGVIHRDIKPANILIDHHDRALLTDFGIALSKNQSSQEASSLGTLRYMSLEQLEGREIDPRSDLFSLGVVLHEAVTGKLPYSSSDPQTIRSEISAGSQKIWSMTGELREICRKSLRRNPAHRYLSVAQFAAELRRTLDCPRRWSPLWMSAIGGVATLLAGIGVWLIVQSMPVPNRTEEPSAQAIPLTSEAGSLLFDGKTRIITPVESFFPCTLEAWFRTTGDSSEQFIIGSDVPNFFGIGIGINRNTPIVETIRGGFDVNKPITRGEWTHLSAVYTESETRLYLNGKQIGVGPATQKPSRSTPFVIGNVGVDHDHLFFHGQIRSLRISKGARYDGDFEPTLSFVADPADTAIESVLIYDGSHLEGGRVIDLSGNGQDGKIESR